MLQSVFQRAVEWQLLDANPVRAARKSPLGRARTVPAIGPRIVEAMWADLRSRGREPDALLLVLLAYAGSRPGESLGLEWSDVRERTLLVERAVSDGHVKGLKNRRRSRAVRLLGRCATTSRRRGERADCGPSRWRCVARDGLAQLAAPGVPPAAARSSRAEAALTGNASHPLAASPLTVAEVLVGPARAGRADEAVGVLRALGVTEVPFPEDASTRLAELRARTGLKLPDCCVLLAAEAAPAEAVLTFDDRLQAEATRRGFRTV